MYLPVAYWSPRSATAGSPLLVAKTGYMRQTKIKIRNHRHWNLYFQIKGSEATLGSPFYTSGTNGLTHNPSSTFHRRKPWQIDRRGRTWSKRDETWLGGPNKMVVSREETYNQPWQTVGLNVVCCRVSGDSAPTVWQWYLDRSWENVSRRNKT